MKEIVQCMLLLLAFFLLLGTSGCATTGDTENASERPWNAPKSWEHGLPTGLMEGR